MSREFSLKECLGWLQRLNLLVVLVDFQVALIVEILHRHQSQNG